MPSAAHQTKHVRSQRFEKKWKWKRIFSNQNKLDSVYCFFYSDVLDNPYLIASSKQLQKHLVLTTMTTRRGHAREQSIERLLN